MHKNNKLYILSGFILMLFSANILSASDHLTFGIFPYLSPKKLLEVEKALKIPVEAATKRKVSLITAPDMKTFIARLKTSEYDLIAVPPNIGRIAQKDFGYRSAVTANNLGFDFIVRSDSDIKKLEDLTSASIAVTAKQSLAYYFAIEALDKNDLIKGQKIKFCESLSHSNSLLSVLDNKCLLAVLPTKLKNILLSTKQQKQLKIIASVKSPLGIVIMVHPRIQSEMTRRIQQKFEDFNQSVAGKAYLAKRDRDPFTKIDEEKLKSFDAILNKTFIW